MPPVDPQYYYTRFLHPRYWPTWLLIGLLRLVAFLPHALLQRVGSVFGWLSYWLARERRRIAETNVDLCFPERSEAERRRLARDSMISLAKGYLECTKVWWADMEPYQRRATVYGAEHLEEAKRRGKGIILLGGHFSILDFAGPLVNKLMTFTCMYRPQGNALFNAVIERRRRVFAERTFSKHQLKSMVRYIRNGGLVWYACDQDFGPKESVFAPFFGVRAATLTAPAWIARATGATVLMVAQFREGGKHYSVHFSPIFEDYPSGDNVRDARKMNAALEQLVLIHPEQYLWVHRRFKTRPEGEPNLYPVSKRKLRKKRKKQAKQHKTELEQDT